jgi:hypothetical protein
MGRPRRLAGPHAERTGARTLVGSAQGGLLPFYLRAALLRDMACAAEASATSPTLAVKPGATEGFRITPRAATLQRREEGRNPRCPSDQPHWGFLSPFLLFALVREGEGGGEAWRGRLRLGGALRLCRSTAGARPGAGAARANRGGWYTEMRPGKGGAARRSGRRDLLTMPHHRLHQACYDSTADPKVRKPLPLSTFPHLGLLSMLHQWRWHTPHKNLSWMLAFEPQDCRFTTV